MPKPCVSDPPPKPPPPPPCIPWPTFPAGLLTIDFHAELEDSSGPFTVDQTTTLATVDLDPFFRYQGLIPSPRAEIWLELGLETDITEFEISVTIETDLLLFSGTSPRIAWIQCVDPAFHIDEWIWSDGGPHTMWVDLPIIL